MSENIKVSEDQTKPGPKPKKEKAASTPKVEVNPSAAPAVTGARDGSIKIPAPNSSLVRQ